MRFTAQAIVAIAITVAGAFGQGPMTIEQVIARSGPDFKPQYEGVTVTVKGSVTSKPILFGEFAHLPIWDGKGHGLLLEAPDFMFEDVTPGDLLEVRGVITQRGGAPVLQPVQLTTLTHSAPPAPLSRPIQQLQSLSAVALTVVTEGRVVALGEDLGGSYLLLDDGQQILYPVYLPKAAARIGSRLARYHVGDRIRVIGVASQAATEPPYQSKFRLIIVDASSLQLMERDSFVAPQLLLAGLLTAITALSIAFRSRQKRLAIRRSTRRIHGLCEELLTCSSLDDVLRKLRNIAPRALEASHVELYRLDRPAQVLRRVLAAQQEPVSVISAKGNGNANHAVSLCFRNRMPLCVPDTRRSSLFWGGQKDLPRGVVLLPTFAREELTGVLEVVSFERPRHFNVEELTALQHLANQIAMLLKMIDQQSRKEQVLRSERLAATGQIISGVAGELKGPLDSILSLAHRLLDHGDPEARAIVRESLRATAILSRYSQAAGSGEIEAAPVEVNAVLARAVDASRKEIPSDLSCELSISPDPLWVEGSASQLESVLNNLLLLAARSAKPSLERTLRVESSLLIRRVLVTIRYGTLFFDETLSSGALPPDQSGLGFGVCRGIVHSMGGEVRIVRAAENSCRIEIDLPAAFPTQEAAGPSQSGEREPARALTALILEPEASSQRRLISYWTSRHHRAVPIHNEAEALELLRRLRIDVIFCAIRTAGGNWVEFFDRVRGQVPAFVLLAEGLGSDAATLFPDSEGFVLRKPLEAGEMDRMLDRIENHVESLASRA